MNVRGSGKQRQTATPRAHEPRRPRPLDPARIEEFALAYVARFGTTRAKLRAYLVRKVHERGWDADGEPSPDARIEAIIERLETAGYVDDAAYARAKSGALLRRGYGGRRVDQALGAAGIEAPLRDALAPDEAAERGAVLVLARKRRFGPFGAPPADRGARDKQIAAMLRAGHPLDSIRALIAMATIAEAEAWAYGAAADADGAKEDFE